MTVLHRQLRPPRSTTTPFNQTDCFCGTFKIQIRISFCGFASNAIRCCSLSGWMSVHRQTRLSIVASVPKSFAIKISFCAALADYNEILGTLSEIWRHASNQVMSTYDIHDRSAWTLRKIKNIKMESLNGNKLNSQSSSWSSFSGGCGSSVGPGRMCSLVAYSRLLSYAKIKQETIIWMTIQN